MTIPRKPREASTSPQFTVKEEGLYLLVIKINGSLETKPANTNLSKALVTIEMKSDIGYLSAADWPLLPVNRLNPTIKFELNF